MKASKPLLADVGIGLAAGLVASALVGPIQNLLYRLTPKSVKQREERVRPGSATEIAAKKSAAAVNAPLPKKQLETASTIIHYASGIPWGAGYTLLRRYSGMSPAGAAFTAGAAMWLILDEGLTPAFGFSAPDRDYPLLTHVRGLLAHLAFGAVAAATAEMLYRLTETGPDAASA